MKLQNPIIEFVWNKKVDGNWYTGFLLYGYFVGFCRGYDIWHVMNTIRYNKMQKKEPHE